MRKSRATLKVVPPPPALESMVPPHVRRRAQHIHIHPALERKDDGEPYMPANETEQELWEDDWCSRCEHDSHERNPCTIKAEAIDSDAHPEWFWYQQKPLCKSFDYTGMVLSEDWKTHASQIAYSSASVDYEPMKFTGDVSELVVNSMMSHWCHACHKKDNCSGFTNLVQDKTHIPDYWLWLKKFPICSKFQHKLVVVQPANQGVLVQPANNYRGYSYWVETIPNSSMYAGFYQMVNAQVPERLGHDQALVVQCSMMLRDAIDQATGNENPGE